MRQTPFNMYTKQFGLHKLGQATLDVSIVIILKIDNVNRTYRFRPLRTHNTRSLFYEAANLLSRHYRTVRYSIHVYNVRASSPALVELVTSCIPLSGWRNVLCVYFVSYYIILLLDLFMGSRVGTPFLNQFAWVCDDMHLYVYLHFRSC